MNETNEPNGGGKWLIVFAVAGAILCGLKLAHVIDWSWVFVTFPFWGPFAAAYLALFLILVVKLLFKTLRKLAEAIKNL